MKEAAAMIKAHIEAQTGSTLDPRDVKHTIASEPGVDIKLSPLAEKYFPFSAEVKNVEKLNIWSAIKQAEANCLPNTHPMIIFRRNHERMWVVLPAEAYFQK
mgnify:CR=1 FL=1